MDIRQRIGELKRRKNAVILAHNYQVPEVQDAADFVGDSLELSRKAAGLEASTIVFCGVHFMAETAAVLAPGKTVLLPEIEAGCPMADMINGRELRSWKAQHPGLPVVCYVNTSAEVKAESDVCCTSSNAIAVVNSLGADRVLFVPDKNLAAYVARETGKTVIAWDGYCYVHHRFTPRDIDEARTAHPGAEVWVHPECPLDVIERADKVLSTGKMVLEARATSRHEIVVGTEKGIIYRLARENPAVRFFPARETALCAHMKMTTLAKVLHALETDTTRVEVPAAIADRARGAIEAMLRIS
ncbi:MAG TPA: quinolinate synthase NadA [Candidatus Aminicenantes bacterium]|nr:quinolinate synthase NadA [Candidatus Aminicenantes bacterium]HRY66321.1 quinolinate synthase NadA [Candidatus Aminicenantes bacterium]HRZ73232.1 quinolinate synthase NadA [Candidatus Aminicenantes bacterium]